MAPFTEAPDPLGGVAEPGCTSEISTRCRGLFQLFLVSARLLRLLERRDALRRKAAEILTVQRVADRRGSAQGTSSLTGRRRGA